MNLKKYLLAAAIMISSFAMAQNPTVLSLYLSLIHI